MKKTLLFLFITMLLFTGNVFSQGNALQFDGVDDYVTIPGFKGIGGYSARTVDFWVYTESKISAPAGFIQWGDPSTPGRFFIVRTTNSARVRISDGIDEWISDSTLIGGQWNHVAVVWPGKDVDFIDDTDGLKVYVNGVLSTANSKYYAGGKIDTDTSLNDVTIGTARNSDGSTYWPFNGKLDEIRIWDTALTSTDILLLRAKETCPESYEHLVAYYRCEAGSGTTLTDKTANHYDGLFAGNADSTQYHPTWAEGIAVTAGGCAEPIPTPTVTNLALNKPVSTKSKVYANYEVANLVDGNASDATGDNWSTDAIFPVTAIIDLGASYTIDSTDLVAFHGAVFQYTISASTDNMNFSQIVDRTANTDSAKIAAPLVDRFDPVVARYIKITLTGHEEAPTSKYATLDELRVFGDPTVVTATNLALNKMTYTAAKVYAKYESANLVDGKTSDATNDTWSTDAIFPLSCLIDLGAAYTLDSTALVAYHGAAFQYTISTATDTMNFVQIVDRSANTDSAKIAAPLVDKFDPVVARYVKITITGHEEAPTSNFATLNELMVFGNPTVVTAANLALYKTTYTASKVYAKYESANLVDGKTSDATNNTWSTDAIFPLSCIVDLGAAYTIDSTLLVAFHGAAFQYTISASMDTLSFVEIVDRSANSDSAKIDSPIVDKFDPVVARYVKITITGHEEAPASNFATLNEFMVFGNPNSYVNNTTPTAVKETLNESDIRVYPNPATTNFTIAGSGEATRVEVFNLQGSKIYETSNSVTFPHQINVSDYMPGIYLVKVSTGIGKYSVRKLVKR